MLQMLFIVYFEDEAQVIACAPSLFICEENEVLQLENMDQLEDKTIVGTCFYNNKAYKGAVLLQVQSCQSSSYVSAW